jgi:hypothetical protein
MHERIRSEHRKLLIRKNQLRLKSPIISSGNLRGRLNQPSWCCRTVERILQLPRGRYHVIAVVGKTGLALVFVEKTSPVAPQKKPCHRLRVPITQTSTVHKGGKKPLAAPIRHLQVSRTIGSEISPPFIIITGERAPLPLHRLRVYNP